MAVTFIHVAPLITSSTFLMGSFAQGVAFRSFQNPKMPSDTRREVFLRWVQVFAGFAWAMALVFMFNITLIGLNLYLGPPDGLQQQGGGASPWLWVAALICSMGHPRPREVTAALLRISSDKYQEYSAEKVGYFLKGYRRVNLEHLFLTDGPSWIFTVFAVTQNLAVCWSCNLEVAFIGLAIVGFTIFCYVSVRGVLRLRR